MPLEIVKAGGREIGRIGAMVDLCLWSLAIGLLISVDQLLPYFFSMSALLSRGVGVVQLGLILLLSSIIVKRRGDTWRSLAFRRPVSIARTAALVCVGYLAAVVVNGLLLAIILPAVRAAPPRLGVFAAIKGHPALYLYWVAFAWISAAVGEELQFRAFLWSRLERLFGSSRGAAWLALLGQAGIFGCAHLYQGLGGVLATAALGVVMVAVSLAARRNLAACMILHGLIDTVSLTVAFAVGLPASLAQ